MLSSAAPGEFCAASYCGQKRFIVNRLFEEIHGAFPHRMHSEGKISVTSDEYDRRAGNRALEFLLQLKPVHSRQENVRHDTIEFLGISGVEKFFRARVRRDLKTGGAELEDESLPHPLVIFDYRNPDASGRRNSFDFSDFFHAAALRSAKSLCGWHYPFIEGVRYELWHSTTH